MSKADEWNAAVEAETQKQLAKQSGRDGSLARQRAIRKIVRENPDLHRQYLRDINANRPNAAIHG